ncbi:MULTISPECIES: sugar ABC transporter ATP-binding protein [Microbacterium]|uniref:Sugar ABC transporter ATP-binding protein n=1 Tax=Microbacterium wangchenii TaxID=2541726 RepID=A0ABX5SU75_9MICO|nr:MULTISPECIES: sugar ABC transporter ATP-binding protein [Microbacterium]MCK6067345.1 sugar ABC transporter ATP-binding protein [Microbacterium sp. EYE_512]QBR89714.1 sugar ABC transporter ATP-binding protein [Microbacterium wangchenii]TXK16688.1 sugar ABC transporter ATP-binding protein [Microbacterium wangchenii]
MASVTQSPPSASPEATQVVLTAQDVSKRYGSTTALAGIDVTVRAGEILGLVGHNGAGKSTLMRVLAGREQPDAGSVSWRGGAAWNQSAAARAGVRMVYQELALCPDLTVAENIALSDRGARGLAWRRTAERHVAEKLDHVFPGHGIAIVRRTSDLTMAQRQMVEIARALCTPDLAMLILDEPTESLSVDATAQLYAHLRELAASGVAMVLISHRMQEVLANADRIAVMKDGRIVDTVAARATSEQALLSTMGGEVHADTATVRRVSATERADIRQGGTVARITGEGVPFVVQPGEIVGLAGLAGHGQDVLLRRLWTSARGVTVAKRRAYVPGDRQTSGIFPLWSVAENLTVSASRQLSSGGVIRSGRKRALADEWVQRLSVKGGARAPITSLSGGNQQKVLVARAFATDAALVLLDDPFRGVDVATKNELYALMRVEASRGRSIVWYSTENGEMAHCDRVYVFRSGRIVSQLADDDITEDRIIADSFGGDDRTQEDAR